MSKMLTLIKTEAIAQGVNPDLVASIVYQESRGNPFAVRYEDGFYRRYLMDKGAADIKGHIPNKNICSFPTEKRLRSFSFGLMQVMGQTAREHGFDSNYLNELLIPETNLQIGIKILKHFLKKAEGNMYQALLFWNGGSNLDYPNEVLEHMEAKSYLKVLV